jgi:hypothetical protein
MRYGDCSAKETFMTLRTKLDKARRIARSVAEAPAPPVRLFVGTSSQYALISIAIIDFPSSYH